MRVLHSSPSRLGTEVVESFAPPPARVYLPRSISAAWRTSEVPYAGKRSRHTPAQKAGLAYQRRVVGALVEGGGEWLIDSGCWFCYCDDGGRRRYCQPDILLTDADGKRCIIIEVKIRWTSDAWWQLRRLYLPVMRRVSPGVQMSVLCITRSYDPAISIEEPVNLLERLEDLDREAFNVLVLR